MNEHGFIKAVHRLLPPDLYRWKIHDTYTGGVPDAWYAGPAGTLFVEYKYIQTLPKRSTTEIKTGLSPLQIAWLTRMFNYGVEVAVIIGSNTGAIILVDATWTQPLYLSNFDKPLSNREVATYIHQITQDGIHGRIKITPSCPKLTKAVAT